MKVKTCMFIETKDNKKIIFTAIEENFKEQLYKSGLKVKDLEEVRYYLNCIDEIVYCVAITKYHFELTYSVILKEICND